MRITRLDLEKVACFDHLSIDFKEGTDPRKADVHLIVGANGTGKSTVLMALAQFFSQHHSTGLDKRFLGSSSTALAKTSDNQFHALTAPERKDRLLLDGVSWHYSAGSLVGFNWHSTDARLAEYRDHIHPGKRTDRFNEYAFSFAAFGYSGFRSTQAPKLKAIAEQTEHPLNNALQFDNLSAAQELLQWVANTKAKEAFARNRGDVDKANQKREAITRIEQIIGEIIEYPFSFVLNEDPIGVLVKAGGPPLDISLLPDGLKSILNWVADLLMRLDRTPWENDLPVTQRSFLLFLDEIEVHLHPAWQRKILPAIQGLFPNAQVFVSTHSPFVIASADDAWIYPLVKDGAFSILGEVLPSMKGNSYTTILKDALGVTAEFSPQVETLLGKFYAARDSALRGENASISEMNSLKDQLAAFGEEVNAVVLPELRQTMRRIQNAESDAP